MNGLNQRLESAMELLKIGHYREVIELLTPHDDERQALESPMGDPSSAQIKSIYQVALYLIDPLSALAENSGHSSLGSSLGSSIGSASSTRSQSLSGLDHLDAITSSTPEERHASLLLSIGDAVTRGQDHEALDACRVASEDQPQSALLHLWRVVIYARLGQAEALFEHVTSLKRDGWRGVIIDISFSRSLGGLRMEFEHPLLSWALNTFLNDPLTRPGDVSWVASQQLQRLWAQHPFDRLISSRLEIDEVALSHLESCLKYLTVPLPELEAQLIQLRDTLLTRCLSETPALNHQLFRLITAYGLQEFMHEYVWWRSSREERHAQTIMTLLAEPGFLLQLSGVERPSLGRPEEISREIPRETSEVALLVALYAMYAPLSDLMGELPASHQETLRDVSLWPDWIHELLEVTLHQSEREARLSDQLPTLGTINNHTSLAVRRQYEENPYPRWSRLNRIPSYITVPYSRYLLNNIPLSLEIDYPYHHDLSILIAGGGTGSHPLGILASTQFEEVRDITVLDLSRASLGYAQRKALEYNIHHVKFVWGDLLDADQLGRDFSLIESVGVLHHMANPDQGLAELRALLKPRGLMVLGLYSQRARRVVTAFRRYAHANHLEPTPEVLRELRHQLLHRGDAHQGDSEIYHKFGELRTFGDAWTSASTLRDLIFHVQETCYTPLELKRLCRAHRLKFLGFMHLSRETRAQYRAMFPHDPQMRSLECWDRYERLYPDTFRKMFNFVCQAQTRSE